jgi:hypothetical protein
LHSVQSAAVGTVGGNGHRDLLGSFAIKETFIKIADRRVGSYHIRVIPTLSMTSQEPTYIRTADDSLTLRFSSGYVSETMHSSSGAWGETLHVYLPVLEGVYSHPLTPLSFLSVGLGLGYVEIMSAGFLLNSLKDKEVHFVSFESEGWLREKFVSWIEGSTDPIYDEIASKSEKYFEIPSGSTKKYLKKLRYEGQWVLKEALDENSIFKTKFSGIFFDAFSKLSEELWTPSFFDWFLRSTAENPCFFATYASRRTLKEALKTAGFKVDKRVGWGHKRECTLAVRPV